MTTPAFSVGADQPRGRPGADADRRQHVQVAVLGLPHAARPRPLAGPDPGERPLLAEAGLVLEPDLDLLLGVGLPDGLDLLDDDLLEDRLQLLVGVLVLGPGHQAAEAEAMQQVVDGLEAQEHAELPLEDAAEVGAVEGADAVLGRGAGLEPLAEAGQFRPGQAGRATGVGPLAQRLGAAAVVAGDPGLDGADAAAEGRGDPGGGAALGGEDDGLVAEPDPLLVLLR